MKESTKTVTRISRDTTYTLSKEEVITAITEYIDRLQPKLAQHLREGDKPSIVLFNTFNDELDLDDLERLDFNLHAEISKDE
jgi:hypothetical protein